MREKVSLLVNNLALLGITEIALLRHDIAISSRTFTLLENNKRAAEVILYELFRRLDVQTSKERFLNLFPCTDGKKAKEFRNAIFKWLVELKRSTTILSTSIVRRSLLDDCAGERYEDLLFSLSGYIYLKQVRSHSQASCRFAASMQVVRDAHATVQDLLVHDLIQRFRLEKLYRDRCHLLNLYREFAERLEELEDSRKHTEYSASDSTKSNAVQALERELSRLREAASGSLCLNAFVPMPIEVDSFFTKLPWDKSASISQHAARMMKRDARAKQQRLKGRIEHLESQMSNLPDMDLPVASQYLMQTTMSDFACAENPSIQRPLFRRKTYEKFKLDLEARLLTLEPGERKTNAVDLNRLRTEQHPSPHRSIATSLPGPTRPRQMKLLSAILERTLPKKRIAPVPLPDFDEEEAGVVLPMTPQRSDNPRGVSSAVKTINRLISVLNEHGDTRVASPGLARARSVNRKLESSFSLWNMEDD